MLSASRGWLGAAQLKKIAIFLAILLGLFFLLGWRLGDLTSGLSPAEASARAASRFITTIKDSPDNAPVKLLQFGATSATHSGAFWLRLGPAVLTIFLTGCFYLVAKSWFGRFVAVLSTLIFATTPWIVLSGRSATYIVLFLWPLAVMAAYAWLNKDENVRPIKWLILAALTAIGLYVPGMLWLLLMGIFINRRNIGEIFSSLSLWLKILSVGLFLVLMVPLISAVVNQLGLARTLLLIPQSWPGLAEIAKTIVWSVSSIVWRTQFHSPIIIGRLPLLDIVQIVLIVFGVMAMLKRAKSVLYSLTSVVAFAVVAAGINRNLNLLTIALPMLVLVMAAGLRYLYLQWQQTFPRNPIPRTLALVLVGLVVALQCFYGIRYALVAWPHTVETHRIYMLK